MKIIWPLLIAFLITGCSALGGDKTADTREWVPVSCVGFADWQVCHEKARRFCPNGYDVRNMRENLVTQNRTMEIACKN